MSPGPPRQRRVLINADPRARILIIGGGNAGIALAARLQRKRAGKITLVEPEHTHTYRPLLTYAGAGLAGSEEYQRPQRQVIPDGVHWVPDRVTALDPHAQVAQLEQGAQLGYDQVVVCAGSTPDFAATPGSEAVLSSPHASTIYLPEQAARTWELIQRFTAGHAVFTVPVNPAPCPQIGLKFLLLACDFWRTRGVLGSIRPTLLTPTATVFGIKEVDRQVAPFMDRYGITVRTGSRVERIDVGARTLTLRDPGGIDELSFDLLHHIPQHAAPQWVREAGLTGNNGFVDVDPHTLQHRRFENVWACGDVADADASPSGGALRKQVPVLAANLMAALGQSRATKHYDGYSVTPIIVERGRALLAEYDRHDQLAPTVPGLPLIKPRRALWAFDRYVQPQQYWHSILRGH